MYCRNWTKPLALCVLLALATDVTAEENGVAPKLAVHLQVDAGTPLRVYITRRVSYRVGEIVQAKVIDPVWAFDRVVIPAGSILDGKVVNLDPVPKMTRMRAIVGGDFTPLKRAEVSFTSLTLPEGRIMPLQTEESLGLGTIYMPPRPAKKPKTQKAASGNPSRFRQMVRQQVQTQLQSQANARSYGLYEFVRGPNKREWLENYGMSKLPYHPQWYRTRTRFDAVITGPLDFGSEVIAPGELAKSGTPVPPDSLAQMRLLNTVTSADARVGDPIEGVLSQPLFGQQHQLVLPQGTRVTGKITLTQHARLFHRGGKLRFAIEDVEPPRRESGEAETTVQPPNQAVQAQAVAVEGDPKAVKVDPEGTATATESKTRLLRPAIAALIAAKSMDNDAGRQDAAGAGGSSNVGGRSLGGFSGFGLLGTIAARAPSGVGTALGFYGLAWSVYSNVVTRGRDVTFQKNTAIAIQFGSARKGTSVAGLQRK